MYDTILKELKKIISENEFDRYIKNLKYIEKESKSDLIVLEAQNPFILNWVKRKYTTYISDIYEKETGTKAEIKIRLKSKRGKRKKENIIIKTDNTQSTILNPSYTFNSFVVGESNKFAYTVAKSVCESPGTLYNPLFIYGGVGLGKTHLLQAIGNEYIKKEKVVIYATSEQFLNDFTDFQRKRAMDRFREKYRNCDLLIIDDIQFFSGKEGTQREFFHTFSELHQQKKQIVLAADKEPKQIAGLEERLKSRFIWGQVADIEPPELETKIAIIKKKCELDLIHLPNGVIHYIATHMDENIREIEGTILKLHAYSNLIGEKVTLEFTKNILKDQINETKKNITIDKIIKVVSSELNVKPSEIRSRARHKAIVNARRIVIYLARNLTPNSMPIIANCFSMKDHSAVSKAMKKIEELIENDANFKITIENLKNKINSIED